MLNIQEASSTVVLAAILLLGIAIPVSEANAETVSFSNITWTIRQGGGGPGPNNWSPSNVVVDNAGLHLMLDCDSSGNNCTTAEVIGNVAVGYGTYTWRLGTSIGKISSVSDAVLGLFMWSDDGDHTELDVEVAEFRPNTNLVHSVQPKSKFYLVSEWNTSTHTIVWRKRCATITSTGSNGQRIVSRFSNPPRPLPTTNPRMNLWFRGGPDPNQSLPDDGNTLNVVILSFTYTPNSGSGGCPAS